jgi:hypothetical protein
MQIRSNPQRKYRNNFNRIAARYLSALGTPPDLTYPSIAKLATFTNRAFLRPVTWHVFQTALYFH